MKWLTFLCLCDCYVIIVNQYTSKDLKGIKVTHTLDDIQEGQEVRRTSLPLPLYLSHTLFSHNLSLPHTQTLVPSPRLSPSLSVSMIVLGGADVGGQ
jgi:hypothetical protein